jgi:hypothetical protein
MVVEERPVVDRDRRQRETPDGKALFVNIQHPGA